MNTRESGRSGEDIAAKYLSKKKYQILERNFSCHFGEIDLIVSDGTYVVFVEVKSRQNDKFGLPREAVNWHKQQTIIKCAQYWLFKKNLTGVLVRFDVVEIFRSTVTHIIDAYRP